MLVRMSIKISRGYRFFRSGGASMFFYVVVAPLTPNITKTYRLHSLTQTWPAACPRRRAKSYLATGRSTTERLYHCRKLRIKYIQRRRRTFLRICISKYKIVPAPQAKFLPICTSQMQNPIGNRHITRIFISNSPICCNLTNKKMLI